MKYRDINAWDNIRGATQKFGEFKQGPNRLWYGHPPLDMANSMLCESVCQQLWSREDVIKFSAFLWGYVLVIQRIFFYNWYDQF